MICRHSARVRVILLECGDLVPLRPVGVILGRKVRAHQRHRSHVLVNRVRGRAVRAVRDHDILARHDLGGGAGARGVIERDGDRLAGTDRCRRTGPRRRS